MLDKSCIASVERWLDSCEGLVPLVVTANHPNRSSLKALIDSHRELKGNWIEAVLGLRIGAIDRAHEIVQNGATQMDRYLHGVVHRIEEDFWNSKYWFRQVSDHDLLSQIGNQVHETLQSLELAKSTAPFKLFDQAKRFAPQNLVDAQESLRKHSSSKESGLVQEIAQAEWNALWKIVGSTA